MNNTIHFVAIWIMEPTTRYGRCHSRKCGKHHLTPLLVHTINTSRVQEVLPQIPNSIEPALAEGWRPATEQVAKKRAASHGDGEPLLVAKNDLPMRAFCRHIHQPWGWQSVSWEILVWRVMRCGYIGRSSWLARGLSSTMPGLPLQNSPDLCSLHVEFGDVSWTHSLYSYMFFISGSEMIFKSL